VKTILEQLNIVFGLEADLSDINMHRILIATPNKRNDDLEETLAKKLAGYEVVRVRAQHELNMDYLQELNPEYIIFPHWSWIIPKEIHSQFECVIFHMTDLPYGRGGSPLQNLIVRGHKETMLTALKCVAELDAGPIYLKESLSLDGTAEEILQRASGLMSDMIVRIVENKPEPVPQSGEVVEFKRRLPEDSDISALESLVQVYDYIRMLDADGYPAAFLDVKNFHLEFNEAILNGDHIEAKVRVRRRDDV
jgi:methionyl-tRNA formyltransferase